MLHSRPTSDVLLQTKEVSPFEQQLYRIVYDWWSVEESRPNREAHRHVSPDGQLVAEFYSYVNRPPISFLLRDEPARRCRSSPYRRARKWFVVSLDRPGARDDSASDGVSVPAHIYKRATCMAQSNGAAVVFVHEPDTSQCRHFWSSIRESTCSTSFFRIQGYTVLDLDYGASDGTDATGGPLSTVTWVS